VEAVTPIIIVTVTSWVIITVSFIVARNGSSNVVIVQCGIPLLLWTNSNDYGLLGGCAPEPEDARQIKESGNDTFTY